MTAMTMNPTLGHLAQQARAQLQSDDFRRSVAEEWRYTDRSKWPIPVTGSFPVQWTCSDTVIVRRASETSDDFGAVFGWDVATLNDQIGALNTLTSASDALIVNGHGQLYLAIGATTPSSVPIVVSVAEGNELDISLVSTGAVPGHVCIAVQLAPTARCIINEIQTNSAPLLSSTCLVRQGSESHFEWVGVDRIEGVGIRNIRVRHEGKAAKTQLTALNLGTGHSQNYIHTHLEHLATDGESRQLVKSILSGSAVSEFKGLVYVAPGAQQTDSSQSNQNMVLSDHARALSRPQLSIFADDVKCAHGATMSQLDDEQIYYLRSRGISPTEARAVLMTGFADEVSDQMSLESVSVFARDAVQKFFETVTAL